MRASSNMGCVWVVYGLCMGCHTLGMQRRRKLNDQFVKERSNAGTNTNTYRVVLWPFSSVPKYLSSRSADLELVDRNLYI